MGTMISVTSIGAQSLASSEDKYPDLQMQINRYAGLVGFAPIDTDGVIGSHTIAALLKIIQYFEDHATADISLVYRIVKDNPTVATIDKNFFDLYNDLATTARGIPGLPAAAYYKAGDSQTSTTTEQSAPPPVLQKTSTQPSADHGNALYWVLGGVAAAALVGVGFLMWKRSKSNPTRTQPAFAR